MKRGRRALRHPVALVVAIGMLGAFPTAGLASGGDGTDGTRVTGGDTTYGTNVHDYN
jgi:hypothetical protein